jgi:hypothetical protein
VAAVAALTVSGGKKCKRKGKATEDDDDSEADKDYAPPKKVAVDDDDELPVTIFGSDGEEVAEETDLRKEIVGLSFKVQC